MKLDLIDRKILYELDFNARMPLTKLAKKLRISRQVADYRIKNLEKKGIIEEYFVIVDNAKLGLNYFRLVIQMTDFPKINEILEFGKQNPNLAFLGLLDGMWNLCIGIWVKDISEFEDFLRYVLYKYGNYISDKEVSIGFQIRHFQSGFLLDKKDNKEFLTGGKLFKIKLDDIDKKLLILLSKNARESICSLSKKLNISERSAAYRIRQLKKRKVILGYKTKIDYKKLGFFNYKVFFNFKKLEKKDETALIFYLKQLPNCIYVTKPIGMADLECELLIRTREDFFNIMQEIMEKFGYIIKKYEHLVIYKELILRYIPVNYDSNKK